MSISNDRSLEERQKTILQAINRVYERYVYCGTLEELGNACLEVAEKITESEISFINELDDDGFLHEISISISGKKQRIFAGKGNMYFSENYKINNLYKSVIMEGKTLLTNDPSNHPDSTGIPKGHINIESFLGVPFLHNGKAKGMVAVANREGGYTEDEKEILEAVASTIWGVMQRKRAEEALRESMEREAYLLGLNDALSNVEDPAAIQVIACRLIKEKLGTEQSSYTDCYDDKGYHIVRMEVAEEAGPHVKGIYREEDYPVGIGILRSGFRLVVEDTLHTSIIPEAEARKWLEYNIRAQISVPLIKNDRLVAAFAVKQSTPRKWTNFEISLVQETAERTWVMVERARAEEALKISEANFRAIFEGSPIGIVAGDMEGRTVQSNPVIERMLGYTKEEMRGKPFKDFTHPEDLNLEMIMVLELIEGKRDQYEIEKRYIRKDGQVIWVKLIGTFMLGGNGDKLGLAMIEDITERKKSEEALREKTRQLDDANRQKEDILESISDCFYALDKDLRFTYANKAAEKIWGIPRDNLIGRMIEDVFPGLIDTSMSKFKQVLEEKVPQHYEVFSKVIERWGDMDVYPTSDGISVYFRDTTERKYAEEALRESEARLEEELKGAMLLQSISTELILEDDLQVIYGKLLNTATKIMKSGFASLQILDYKEDGNPGLHLLASRGFGGESVKNWEWVSDSATTACAKAYRSGKRVVVPCVEKCVFMQGTKDQRLFLDAGIRAMQSTPLISRNGKIVGVISTHWNKQHEPSDNELRLFDVLTRQAADIIERRKYGEALRESQSRAFALVEELKKADENKNAFLNSLSHELRNPLATISIGLQLMDKTEGEESVKIKEAMESQIDQLCHLVDDLLDLTRINNNKVQLNTQCLDLKQLVRAVGEDHKAILVSKGIKFEIETTKQPVYAEADPVRLKQIIGNLLHNAFKYTDKGGEVLLSLSKEEDSAFISVRDSGIGIEPGFLSEIFKPFTQADVSLDRTNGGLGLGLSIVKGIAELHGGNVSASSEGRGKGAEFRIRIPASDIAAGKETEQGGDLKNTKPLKVLLIEDNKDLSGMLCSMLKIMGHEAAAVYNGAEAIGEARALRPDVIVCDIGLPGMTGYEVAETVRKDDTLSGVFLIALTGYAGRSNRELASKAGFDRYLCKPVDMEVLKQVLAEAAERK